MSQVVNPTGLRRLVAVSLVAGACALAGCSPAEPAYEEKGEAGDGQSFEISLRGLSPPAARAAAAEAARDLRFVLAVSRPWGANPLGRTNQLLAATAEFSANPSVLPLIRRAQILSERSGGLFNPAIGRLLDLWGFSGDAPPTGPPPDPAAIAALVAWHPTMADISLRGIRMRSANRAVKLDLGALAKGHALDVALARLREAGAREATVRAGRGLRVLTGDQEVTETLDLAGGKATVNLRGDVGLYTLAARDRYFDYDGTRYPAVIDPRTGRPAEGVASVTVVQPSAGDAGAIATALFVAGAAGWPSTASALGARQVMLVDTNGRVHLTAAMARQVRFAQSPPPLRVVELPPSPSK